MDKCRICFENDVTKQVFYMGDKLGVCDTCFDNRPDDAYPVPVVIEAEE